MKRITVLDGLRAVSIALVVIGHTYQSATHQNPHTPLWIVLGNGSGGVELFFILSGFLITTLLVAEHDRTGAISFTGFYLRRALRIIPPFYVYILAIGLLDAAAVLHVAKYDYVSAAGFVWDYASSASSWAFGHAWSLSVEEQFYLLWPPLLFGLLVRWGPRTAVVVAACLICTAPLSRLLTHVSGVVPDFRIYVMLHTRIDSLMFGCLAALVRTDPRLAPWLTRTTPGIWLFPAFALVLSPLLAQRFGGAYSYLLGYSLNGAALTWTLLWLLQHPAGWLGRILTRRPLQRLGLISYSLYLWHVPFLHTESPFPAGLWPVGLVCAVLAAELSYRCVELPCARLRVRLTHPRGREVREAEGVGV